MSKIKRVVFCGSVDDGKSTLIGNLLLGSNAVPLDKISKIRNMSKVGSPLDGSKLLDGLAAEKEQGITIDVSHQSFSIRDQRFTFIDCPGHVEYTRNMVTGASQADIAVVLIDASKGILEQTRRHIAICKLVGIKHYIFAVNKMDLVNGDGSTFYKIQAEVHKELSDTVIHSCAVLPICALECDTLITDDPTLYGGDKSKCLLSTLLEIKVIKNIYFTDPRFVVQAVVVVNNDSRYYLGKVVSGTFSKGTFLDNCLSGTTAIVDDVFIGDKSVATIDAGDSAAIKINTNIDAPRGTVFSRSSKPTVASKFNTRLVWLNKAEYVNGKQYVVKIGTSESPCTLEACLKDYVKVETKIQINDICDCVIKTNWPMVFDVFDARHGLSRFILIDNYTKETVAAGVITGKSGDNTAEVDVGNINLGDTGIIHTTPYSKTIWLTGLSGAGKTTLALSFQAERKKAGESWVILDGDVARNGLTKGLGFSDEDRKENITRIAHVAKILNNIGINVIASTISPLHVHRIVARDIIGYSKFFMCYVDTPLDVCIERDSKELYKKSSSGTNPNMTGVGSSYQPPEDANLALDLSTIKPSVAANILYEKVSS